jgi:phosphotransferase system HPr (HPr) family protein
MMSSEEHKTELTINNRMGFHVRPVQRFAELARMFKADVEVELRGRAVPGKSVMNLMSLGGRYGDTLQVSASGEDARQCLEVLKFLGEHRFFVEDDPDVDRQTDRHICRLSRIASAFESEITVKVDGAAADAKRKEDLRELGLNPRSEPEFDIEGPDAEQARAIIENLVQHCFYVEDEMVKRSGETG